MLANSFNVPYLSLWSVRKFVTLGFPDREHSFCWLERKIIEKLSEIMFDLYDVPVTAEDKLLFYGTIALYIFFSDLLKVTFVQEKNGAFNRTHPKHGEGNLS
jgi:hypothetical protein